MRGGIGYSHVLCFPWDEPMKCPTGSTFVGEKKTWWMADLRLEDRRILRYYGHDRALVEDGSSMIFNNGGIDIRQ